mgnify:CR=1 FL=1
MCESETNLYKCVRPRSFFARTIQCVGCICFTASGGSVSISCSCPDQICVSQGWLSDQAAPIVCMPHRLIIRLKDAAAQADAVAQ